MSIEPGSDPIAAASAAAVPSVWRELPLVLVVTCAVSVAPAIIAASLVPPVDLKSIALCAAIAVALSAVVVRVGAAVWASNHRSWDVLFADLMIWGWLYRRFSERRLASAEQSLIGTQGKQSLMPIALVLRLARLLEARDIYTYGHSRRVARHAQTIARGMRLPPAMVEKIRLAAIVHDVGKIHIPREILTKPGRLTDAEYELVMRHPGDGAEALSHIRRPRDRRHGAPPSRAPRRHGLSRRSAGRADSPSAPGSSPSPTRSTR